MGSKSGWISFLLVVVAMIITITCINYGAFLIGLLTGFWRSYGWGRSQAPERRMGDLQD